MHNKHIFRSQTISWLQTSGTLIESQWQQVSNKNVVYKNINRFDDICWYFTLYLMFIVWLRFVNQLLNYLLTYLLTYLVTYLVTDALYFLLYRCYSPNMKTMKTSNKSHWGRTCVRRSATPTFPEAGPTILNFCTPYCCRVQPLVSCLSK